MTRHKAVPALLMCVLVAVGLAMPALAQEQRRPAATAPARRPTLAPARAGSWQVLFGGELMTQESLGSTTARLQRNDTSSATFDYFTTSATRQTAPSFAAGIGYNITRMFTVEGNFLVGRGNLRGTVTNDREHTEAFAIEGRLTQYIFDVTLLAHLPDMAFSGGAGVPYLEAGVGYLRQLQEGNFAPATGQAYHVGGGIRYIFGRRPNSRVSGLGFRVGGRAYIQNKGFSFGSSQRVFAGINGGMLVLF